MYCSNTGWSNHNGRIDHLAFFNGPEESEVVSGMYVELGGFIAMHVLLDNSKITGKGKSKAEKDVSVKARRGNSDARVIRTKSRIM